MIIINNSCTLSNPRAIKYNRSVGISIVFYTSTLLEWDIRDIV